MKKLILPHYMTYFKTGKVIPLILHVVIYVNAPLNVTGLP